MEEANPWANVESHALGQGDTAVKDTSTADTRDPELANARSFATGKGLLLLVFIHGFKGSAETTFEDFPNRLTHVLQETHPDLRVKPIVYPTYDTRGALATAVANFIEWLTLEALTLESKPEVTDGKEVPFQQSGRGGGRGTVRIVLCGHSMGGLVAVDAALKIATDSMSDKAQSGSVKSLWPRVVGVIAYDSPYYGVHPNVFKNQASKYISYAQQARDIGSQFGPLGAGLATAWGMGRARGEASSSSQQPSAGRLTGSASRQAAPSASAPPSGKGFGWKTALWATGALATAATAGGVAAFYNREQIGGAYSYLTDHFEYVSNLWDDKALRERLDALIELPSVFFHSYYNHLPASTTMSNNRDRTFIILPPRRSKASRMFTPLINTVAGDEIAAHITMFSSKENPKAYIELGRHSAELIDTIVRSEELHAGDQRDSQSAAEVEDLEQQDGQGLRRGDEGLEEQEEQVRRMQRESSMGSGGQQQPQR